MDHQLNHDDIIEWKCFPRYWPFLRGIHRSVTKMFSLICAWTSGWVNNAKVGDLRPHCAHNDITVIHFLNFKTSRLSPTSKYQRKYRYLDHPICISLTFLLCLVVATLHQYHLITYVGYTPLEKMCRKKWKRIFYCSHSAMIIFEYVYFSNSWAKTHVRDKSGLVLRLLLILQKKVLFFRIASSVALENLCTGRSLSNSTKISWNQGKP